MRDWDIPCLLIYVWAQNADYITYEGLRQVQWNFNWRIFFMDYITYEGLRHFRCEGKCWVYWKMGLHYLWGIETEDFWSSNPLPSIGLHYLWGIETIKFLLSLDSVKLSRDYITYEGLRLPEFHLEQRKYKFVQLRITLPMRDWDTTAAAYLTRSFE